MNNSSISEPSLRSLFIQAFDNKGSLGTGTGFLVKHNNEYFLITNRHVISGKNSLTGELMHKAKEKDKDGKEVERTTGRVPSYIEIWHHAKNNLGVWEKRIEKVLDKDDMPVWFEHSSLHEGADIVAIKLTQKDGIDFYPYSLENNPDSISNKAELDLKPTDMINIVGFPFGFNSTGNNSAAKGFAIWNTGFIAAELYIPYLGRPIFLVDSRTRPGQSGSPVIFHRNAGITHYKNTIINLSKPVTRLLGIYSGRICENSDTGMVWKLSAIKELVDAIK